MSGLVKWGLVWLGVVTAFAWFQVFHLNNRPQLIFWPGGQDEMFLQSPSGQRVLVNGGEGKQILRFLDGVMPWGEKKLDLIVLTSWRKDYLEGLISVLENYQVKNVLWLGAVNNSPVFQEWSKILQAKKVNNIIARKGQEIHLGSWVLEILSPVQDFSRYQLKTEKNVIWKLNTGQRDFLFLGRASSVEISGLKNQELKAQIVEANESQKDLPSLFWKRINPSLIIVSGGWPKKKVFSFPCRQTQKEGKVIINF